MPPSVFSYNSIPTILPLLHRGIPGMSAYDGTPTSQLHNSTSVKSTYNGAHMNNNISVMSAYNGAHMHNSISVMSAYNGGHMHNSTPVMSIATGPAKTDQVGTNIVFQ